MFVLLLSDVLFFVCKFVSSLVLKNISLSVFNYSTLLFGMKKIEDTESSSDGFLYFIQKVMLCKRHLFQYTP